MALSARDWRILKAIEENLAAEDRSWVARFDRLADPRRRPIRRRWKVAVAVLFWVGLVCADAATHQGVLLWIAGGAGVAGLTLIVWRHRSEKPAVAHQTSSRRHLAS